MTDIHNYGRRLERTLARMEALSLLPEDRALIMKFKDFCLCNQINMGKVDTYLLYLKKFVILLHKPIRDANKDDIMRVVAEINKHPWSESTKNAFKIAVRRLYQIVYDMEGTKEYPELVSWLKLNFRAKNRLMPEELLTPDEIRKIIQACTNIRDKAFIAVLAESGARIGEIASMKIKHISFEKYGARIMLSGKTGSRRILIIKSAPYLKEWISEHPYNLMLDSPLWQGRSGEICYNQIAKIIKNAARLAGVKKRVYPHLFRHSRATQLAEALTDTPMKEYLGWTRDSKMTRTYVHMSGRNIDSLILRAHGIYVPQNEGIGKIALPI